MFPTVYDTGLQLRCYTTTQVNASPARLWNPMVMSLVSHSQRQFEYDDWANTEVWRALSALTEVPPGALRLLTHIVAAEQLWLDRLGQAQQSMAVWPELSLTELDAQRKKTAAAWKSYLAAVSEDELDKRCHYLNSKGQAWDSTVLDILTHVLLHSSYHRGQVALEMRRAGLTPAYTDYIHAVRQRLVE